MIRAVLEHRLVPVLTIASLDHCVTIGRALLSAGLPVAEVTFRTPHAASAIERLADMGLSAGAGTVITDQQLDQALTANASFVVSPGSDSRIIGRCLDSGVPVLPGAATATEVQSLLRLGVDVAKFFPARAAGGPALVAAFAAPFPDMSFVPTGGIGPDDMGDYLALPNVAAIGGSWLTPPELVERGDVETLTRLIDSAVASASTPTAAAS